MLDLCREGLAGLGSKCEEGLVHKRVHHYLDNNGDSRTHTLFWCGIYDD